MSVKINDVPLKKMIHNGSIVKKWLHDGVRVYGGSGVLSKGTSSARYYGTNSLRELTTNAVSWIGDTSSGIFTMSGTTTYRLTANYDLSSVTVTLTGSQWRAPNGDATLKFGFSKNGAYDKSIVYKYVVDRDMQYYQTTSITYTNVRKGDYITLLIETSNHNTWDIGLWLGSYTVSYSF